MGITKYNVGDKVLIRKDLRVSFAYGDVKFSMGMLDYTGKEATIIKVDGGLYRIDLDSRYGIPQYWWTSNMFENQNTYCLGDEVVIREDLLDGANYGGLTFTNYMNRYKGWTTKIVSVLRPNVYFIKADTDQGHWWWTSQMFEN